MRHLRGLVSTTQALRQIFLSPLLHSRPQLLQRILVPSQIQLRSIQSRRPRQSVQRTASPTTQYKDEDIPSEYVQVVNDEGNLDPPARLANILRTIRRPDNFLLQVSPGDGDQLPVCKIMSRFAMQEHERAKAKAAHAAKNSLKQIELNWAIDAHDLSHRLKQLTAFLEKGRKVEVTLSKKKRKRAPTVEEIKNVMDSVMETARETNSMQVKPMEGEPGKFVKLVLKKREA